MVFELLYLMWYYLLAIFLALSGGDAAATSSCVTAHAAGLKDAHVEALAVFVAFAVLAALLLFLLFLFLAEVHVQALGQVPRQSNIEILRILACSCYYHLSVLHFFTVRRLLFSVQVHQFEFHVY
jgi:hypothetical protein